MKTLTLLLMLVVLALTGCTEQQQSPQTANQMKNIEIWAQKTENNLRYLYSQTLDPNDPNSLVSRVEVLEDSQLEVVDEIPKTMNTKKKKGWW